VENEAIDVFCHVFPLSLHKAVRLNVKPPSIMFDRLERIRSMVDLEARLRLIEEFAGYRQIISLAGPPLETLAPAQANSLSSMANEEMARWVAASSGRICGFAASLPLNDPLAAVKEATHAVQQLGAVAVQVYTSVDGNPLDDSRFAPFFETIAELDVPILLHPKRSMQSPDYPSEPVSKYDLWWAIGWPYETTLAMARLVLSGLFERWPQLKIVAHHVGGFMPMLAGRLGPGMELLGTRNPPELAQYVKPPLEGSLIDACRRFYADTASFGSREAIECGLAFFGAQRILFATDMPFDPGGGPDYIRSTLAAISAIALPNDYRRDILSLNARTIFKLQV
jgi:predicted TIM-barrel fold metal-dependent hydrolase